jgi:hypothetical protein
MGLAGNVVELLSQWIMGKLRVMGGVSAEVKL